MVKVIQKVEGDQHGLLCQQIGADALLFLTGYPRAAQVVDGNTLTFSGKLVGTYSYLTTQGSQATVRHVEWTGDGR